MAITYKELKRAIRFKERDNNEVRFSDYDIKEALNECIRYFNNSYALQHSDFLEKNVVFADPYFDNTFSCYGIDLPEDFLVLHDLRNLRTKEPLSPCSSIEFPKHNQYKVTGNKIYFGCHKVIMCYKAAIPEIKKEEDALDVPFIFKDVLVKITCMILENNAGTDVLMDAVNDAAASLLPRRKYVHAKMKMPFIV